MRQERARGGLDADRVTSSKPFRIRVYGVRHFGRAEVGGELKKQAYAVLAFARRPSAQHRPGCLDPWQG